VHRHFYPVIVTLGRFARLQEKDSPHTEGYLRRASRQVYSSVPLGAAANVTPDLDPASQPDEDKEAPTISHTQLLV